jgi:hypothetical protein
MDATNVDGLNVLLRDELAAVETYDEALDRRSALVGQPELARCKRSHEVRVRILREKIVALGGTPALSSGLRGEWEKIVEAATPVVGDDVAVRALEAGEAHVLREYRTGMRMLDPEVRIFVERNLLPAEEHTRRTLGELVERRFH